MRDLMSGLRCRCKIIALRPQSARKPHYAIDNPFCRLNRFPLARREPISPKESSTRWSIGRLHVSLPAIESTIAASLQQWARGWKRGGWKRGPKRKKGNPFESVLACSVHRKRRDYFSFFILSLSFFRCTSHCSRPVGFPFTFVCAFHPT